LCRSFIGRPTPLQDAPRLSAHGGGARILLKREDLAHTGAHKINNAIGQALLAKRLGVTRVIAETGAGQHGVATATACALLGHEARAQALDLLGELPGAVVACVGGGSNSIGTFMPFAADSSVELHGAEAAGDGIDTPRHAASIVAGRAGVLHGAHTMLLQDDD